MSYRLPREPSTPRIAVWRKLKNLGIEQIGDGLVALPDDARNREHLEWIAAEVLEADGEAMVWVAQTDRASSERLATQMRAARDLEYRELVKEASDIAASPDHRTVQRLRRTLRKINRRDYFKAPTRDRARLAIDALASTAAEAKAGASR